MKYLIYFLLFILIEMSKEIANSEEEDDFTIALIADAHYTGRTDYYKRLVAAVNYINEKAVKQKIEIVGVLGDTAYESPTYIQAAKELLDKLNMPYFPIIGDNPIQHGEEEDFYNIFKPHFEYLSTKLGNWEKTNIPVEDPTTKQNLYLENYGFDLHGLRIICTDWNTRVISKELAGQQADLFDFPGGTFHFFQEQIQKYAGNTRNNLLIFSHHALHVSHVYPLVKMDFGAFSPLEFNKIVKFTITYKDYLGGNYAGHYHFPLRQYISEGGYQINCLSSLHPPQYNIKWLFYKPRIMFLKVKKRGNQFLYEAKTIIIPLDEI